MKPPLRTASCTSSARPVPATSVNGVLVERLEGGVDHRDLDAFLGEFVGGGQGFTHHD